MRHTATNFDNFLNARVIDVPDTFNLEVFGDELLAVVLPLLVRWRVRHGSGWLRTQTQVQELNRRHGSYKCGRR
jgi:hypothetical protein